MSMRRLGTVERLRLVLWPLGAAAEIAAFYFLFRGPGDVPTVAVVHRAVGGSFIACGLVAWQYRPHNRSGVLMTATGFLFFAEPLLAEVDSSVGFTLAQVFANWWTIPFAALVLAFPSGRISRRIDAALIAGFVFVQVVLQLVWVLFLEFPLGTSNVLLISAEPGLADAIDLFQRWFSALVLGLGLVAIGVTRWLRAPPPLRRLLLPTLAGSLAIFIFVVQIVYELVVNEPSLGSTRATQLASALAFVTVPLAFLVGLLRAQFARAGVAEIVVALQRAPGRQQLADVLAKALGDRSLVLGYWLPRFESYVDAEGQPVILPPDGSGRAATFVDHEGRRVAALVHDAALSYEPELLQIVCAAADVALEQERLQAELKARAEELIGSRARIVEAGDAERRRLERNLHDGAQQRLIALSLELSLLKSAVAGDGDVSRRLDEARDEIAASLGELREVARGIHPAVVAAHGLEVALEQLAARAVVPVRLNVEIGSRLPERLEVAAFYVVSESLANVAKHADATSAIINVSRANGHVTVEVTDDGVGGADTERGSGLRGLADRVEALEGRLRIWSPAGGGTRLRAEIPCAS